MKPRYLNGRRPFKVTPERLRTMRRLRAQGKPYQICGELVGVCYETARKWLTGVHPK